MTPEKVTAEGEDNVVEIQPVDVLEPQEASQEGNDPFTKGRERIAAIGTTITAAKEKAKNAFKGVGSKLSSFWSRTKSAVGTTAAAALSADVLAKQAYQATTEKVSDINTSINEGIQAGGAYVGYKAAEASAYVGEKITEAGNYANDKAEQFTDYVDTKYDAVVDFKNQKVEQVKTFANEKIELGKDIAYYVQQKSSETLEKARNGIKNRYDNVKKFGEDSIASAKLEAARIKGIYNEKMNNLRLRRLQAEYDIVSVNESAVSAQAEKLRKQRDELAGKMELLLGLESVAA